MPTSYILYIYICWFINPWLDVLWYIYQKSIEILVNPLIKSYKPILFKRPGAPPVYYINNGYPAPGLWPVTTTRCAVVTSHNRNKWWWFVEFSSSHKIHKRTSKHHWMTLDPPKLLTKLTTVRCVWQTHLINLLAKTQHDRMTIFRLTLAVQIILESDIKVISSTIIDKNITIYY